MTLAPAPPALAIEDLCVCVHAGSSRKTLLSHVSLQLAEQEIVGLVGESGSGKSSLAMACLGLVSKAYKTRISGRLKIGPQTLHPGDEQAFAAIRGSQLSMVFQDASQALNPYLTIGTQLDEVVRYHHQAGKAQARAASLALLEQVGLPDPKSAWAAYPHTLSGGMRQRAMVAMALMGRPKVLIADEPTTALDVTLQAQIVALLQQQCRQRDMAMLFISHDIALVAQLTTRVAVMLDGLIVEVADVTSLIASPRHPYSASLVRAAYAGALGDTDLRLQPQHTGMPEQRTGCSYRQNCPRAISSCHHLAPPMVRPDPGSLASYRCFNPLPPDAPNLSRVGQHIPCAQK